MEATRRLEIDLPEELADEVKAQVRSGRFSSESEAVGAALTLLLEQGGDEEWDDEVEHWLRTVVVERVKALKEGRLRTKTVDEVRASLAARREARDRAA